LQELQAIAREVLVQTPQEKIVTSPREIPQCNTGVEPGGVADQVPLENWGDLTISATSLANLDNFWTVEGQTDMPRWFDYT
jgi:hypothetical protein